MLLVSRAKFLLQILVKLKEETPKNIRFGSIYLALIPLKKLDEEAVVLLKAPNPS